MTLVIYLIGGIAALSVFSLFLDKNGYWDESITMVQILLTAIALFVFHKRINKPLKWINKKSELIQSGQLEIDLQNNSSIKIFNNINKLIDSMALNMKSAINFIKNIEDGKLDVRYSTEENGQEDIIENNKLAESLVNLRNKLGEIASSENERNWTTEGLARFVEILRANDQDIQTLSDKILSNLVKYLKANQGQLYILKDDDPSHVYLELAAFYAFDRRKYVENTIEIGQGLIGQAYQEKGTIVLTEIPDNYVKVTSGLGEANPRCLLIAPLKINDMVYGVLELASFQTFKNYEVLFIEKIGESIASTISNAKINYKTKALLSDLQQQQEEMKAQEEELRQNMEELQATHEEMSRKEKEITRLLELSNDKERQLEQKLKEIEKMTKDLELENAMFTGLMDILSDRVTIKDKKGVYLRLNKTKTEALKQQGIENALGKSDREFFGEEHYLKALAVEKQIMESGKGTFQIEEKIKTDNDKHWWASTTRVPFKNKEGITLGTIVVTKDVTKEKEYQEQIEQANAEIKKLKSKQKDI